MRIFDREMRQIIGKLKRAVKQEKKEQVLKIYQEVEGYDFQEVSTELFEEYNELMEKANYFLYQ